MNVLLNLVMFQLGWLACVLGGAYHRPWIGTALVALVIVVHLSQAPRPLRESTLILLVGVLGGAWDSLLVAQGLLVYPSGTLVTGIAPHWIVAMWLLFATTLNVSLNWLKGRYLLAILCGAIAGPLAYYTGARLGGVVMPEPAQALTALSLGWAVLMPLLTLLAGRFDGMQLSQARAATVECE
jgi:hypothetical protein